VEPVVVAVELTRPAQPHPVADLQRQAVQVVMEKNSQ
jgi:hypothetical protein